MLALRVIIGSLAVCTACGGLGTIPAKTAASPTPGGSVPDVRTILAAMQARYRDAKTYRDEGTYRGVIRPRSPDPSVTTARFQTRWVAPDRLSFTLNEDATEFFPAKTLAIWTPGPQVVKSLFLDEVRDEGSLETVLRSLQGVSHGMTGLVPLWLGRGCQCSFTYELRGTVACGTERCFQLEGSMPQDRHVTLFVSMTTSALIKYVYRAIVEPAPLSEEELAHIPVEVRDAVVRSSNDSFEVEDTVEFSPTFDDPLNVGLASSGPTTR